MNHEDIVDKLLAMDDSMRHVGLVNDKGYVIMSKMKENKIAIHNQEQKIRISHDLNLARQMHAMFDETLGKASRVHMMREKVHLLIFYQKEGLVYVTCEGYTDEYEITDIAKKIEATLHESA